MTHARDGRMHACAVLSRQQAAVVPADLALPWGGQYWLEAEVGPLLLANLHLPPGLVCTP